MLPLIALAGIGKLLQKRRSMRSMRSMQAMQGSAYGQAMNTQPQGPPTTALSQAATSGPQMHAGGSSTFDETGGGRGSLNPPPGQVTTPGNETGGNFRSQYQGGRTRQVHEGAAPRSGQSKTLIPTKGPSDYKQYIRQGPGEGAGDPGLAARMGQASLARTKKKNLEQQAALSQRAMR